MVQAPRHPGLEPGSRSSSAPKAGPRITSGVTIVARPNPDPTTDQRVTACPLFLPRQGEVAAKLTEGEVNDPRRACGHAPSTMRYANGPPPPLKRGRIHHTRGRAFSSSRISRSSATSAGSGAGAAGASGLAITRLTLRTSRKMMKARIRKFAACVTNSP